MNAQIREAPGALESVTYAGTDVPWSVVLDRTSDGVLLADASGTIVYATKPLLDLFGYVTDDLVGQRIEILIPDDLRDDHRHRVEEYSMSPQPRPMGREDLDIEGRRADGSCFPIDVQLNAIPGSSLVVATVRDMTAQRHLMAERALDKIDLAHVRAEAARLRESLDLVIQQLFALGMSIAASASNEVLLTERMTTTLHGIDHIIEVVQACRGAVGP